MDRCLEVLSRSTQVGGGVCIPIAFIGSLLAFSKDLGYDSATSRSFAHDDSVPGFYINLPIGAFATFLLLVIQIPNRLPSTSDSTTDGTNPKRRWARGVLNQLDFLGFVLFAGFAIMISLALEWGGSAYAWNSSVIIGLFCAAGVSLVLFGCWERHVGGAVAMIPISVASHRQVWCSCFFLGLFSGALLIFSYYLPIYFQAVKNVSPTMSGVYMLPGIGGQIVMAIVTGAIS